MKLTGAERIWLAEALEKQLELKLDKRKVPMPAGHRQRQSNAHSQSAGMILNLLSSPPAEFDAVAIKPATKDFRFGTFRPQHGSPRGRWRCCVAGCSRPTGAISLFKTSKNQLDLKLEQATQAAKVRGNGHIEPKPIEN